MKPVLRKHHLLFLSILIEGYVVLACELLAIRQLIPFVGSGIEITAIIIGAVLLPLAVGYHAGGYAFKNGFSKIKRFHRSRFTVRRLLLRNVFVSLVFLCFGLSYLTLDLFFRTLNDLGAHSYMLQAGVYSIVFLVVPMFLLGQTVPLISNYFSQHRLSEITGKMLFFSTTGAFFGSLFSTLILMTFAGVHNTVIVTLALLVLLCLLLSGLKFRKMIFGSVVVVCFAALINNGSFLASFYHMVSDNAYNTVTLKNVPDDNSLVMKVNGSTASMWNPDADKRSELVRYIDKNFIAPIARGSGEPRDILIVGAGGFIIGYDDAFNRYTFVDIDKALKHVAENHFLPGKLPPNKQFVAASARAFVHNDTRSYDLIIVDVFTMRSSPPMECTTREFLLDVKSRLKKKGILIVNVVASPSFTDKFSARYARTFASVFPLHSRQIIQTFDPWTPGRPDLLFTNVLYIYFDDAYENDGALYTDDKNSYSLDQPQYPACF